MALTQQTFLGSSIRYYNTMIGWNEQPSDINIGLVDDPTNGDQFLGYPFYDGPNPYYPGMPAIFIHEQFTFGGIIQSMNRLKGPDGNPVYEVSMKDPRSILEGVQLILNDYTGDVSAFTNILNVYGYLEATNGFGGSQVNDSGIPWGMVANAISQMLSGAGGIYGNTVSYRGQPYGVYMLNFPALPADYRVGGSGNMSLLEFIQEICEVGGLDWFCNLETHPSFAHPLIVIYTISRHVALQTGAIEEYTESVGGITNSAGIELIDSTTKKFVVGGAKEDVWFANYTSNYSSEADSMIWPYWGLFSNGDAIIGTGTGDNHTFPLDSSLWAIYGVGNTYWTDVAEMRAALDSQESWEALLWFRNSSSYPQAGRAFNLGLVSDVNYDLGAVLQNVPATKLTNLNMMNFTNNAATTSTDFNMNKNKKNLYDIIRSFAQDYFGKKFMVRIPNIAVANIPDSFQVKYSRIPVEAAYIDESNYPTLFNNRLCPYNINQFTTTEGKFEAYVRFDNAQLYDFSEISEDDRYIEYYQNGAVSVFVKCQVDEVPVFFDAGTATSPRAVITLPGVVRIATTNSSNNDSVSVLKEFLLNNGVSDAKITTLLNGLGGDSMAFGKEAQAVFPDMAAIPMRSNIECYGPWWSFNGIDGKVEFEKDETLVPWNFGSYNTMNQVGYAKVQDVFSNQPWSETGHVEFPGFPNMNIGAQLTTATVFFGPYVSDVNCSIGPDGVKTAIRFQRYTPSFGRFARYNADKLTKLGKLAQQQRRNLRDLYMKHNRINGLQNVKANYFKSLKARRDKSQSSHFMICGQIHGDSSTGYAHEIVSQPPYNTTTQLSRDYTTKGGCSYDGLFRVFSTDPAHSFMPHFSNPVEEEEGSGFSGPTSLHLNPYTTGHDIGCIVHSNEMPQDLVNGPPPSNTSYRGIALRGPIVVAGWGYDTNGKPVPNEDPDEPTDNFAANHLSRSENWPCGPIDLRWDNSRKVWSAGGTSGETILVKVLPDGVTPPAVSPHINPFRKVYRCQKAEVSFNESAGSDVTVNLLDEYIFAGNFRSLVVLTDRYYLAYKIGDKYVLDVQSDFTDE